MEKLRYPPPASRNLFDNNPLSNILESKKEVNNYISQIENAFFPFGFTKNEVKIYIQLALSGIAKARELSAKLSIHRTETYRLLKSLEKRGLLTVVLGTPLKFKAVSFSEAYDILLKTQSLNLLSLKNKKGEFESIWRKIPKKQNDLQLEDEIFQILEGEERVILKINQISKGVTNQIHILMPDRELTKLYHSQFIENIKKKSNDKIKICLITNSSTKSRFIIEKMNLENVKYVLKGPEELPTFIITDQKELLFSVKKTNNPDPNKNENQITTYLWTNYYSMIKSMTLLFNSMWSESIFINDPKKSFQKQMNITQ